jgi:hypothetical protein
LKVFFLEVSLQGSADSCRGVLARADLFLVAGQHECRPSPHLFSDYPLDQAGGLLAS